MKRNNYPIALLILAFALFILPPLKAAIKAPVKTKSGAVSGVSGTDPSVTAFKGIPVAVGEIAV